MPPSATEPHEGSAADEIRTAISAAGGSLRFDEFVDVALYGTGGFYTTGGGTAGRRGDFITSPEVGPLFGAVLARWIDATWRDLGEPSEFFVVEAGAGPGTLARSIRAAEPACLAALTYVAVEVSAAQRERHPGWVVSTSEMPTEAVTGVVLANELLDNLAFRLLVMDGGWREAFVMARPDATFAELLQPVVDIDSLDLPTSAAHGARLPIQQRATSWVVDALGRLEAGRLLLIDYASPTTSALADRPWRDWLRTYRNHDRGAHYLREPGSQDITAEVALDQLFAAVGAADRVCPQHEFLRRWGIEDLVDEGRKAWRDQAASPTVAAVSMRSRVREAEALRDPKGLGGFQVMEYFVPRRTTESVG